MMAFLAFAVFILNCVLSKSADYFTVSCNTNDGHVCQFPFVDGKNTYYGCIKRHVSLQCKTNTNAWRDCDQKCPRAAVKFTVDPMILIHENPVVLECAARGSPNPGITWLRKSKKAHNQVLYHSKAAQPQPPAITFSHLVLNRSDDMQYEYLCEADNGHTRAVSQSLNVSNKATFLGLSLEEKDSEITQNSHKDLLLVVVSLFAALLLLLCCFLLYRNRNLRLTLSSAFQSKRTSVMTSETTVPYPAGMIYNSMYPGLGLPGESPDHSVSGYSSDHVYSTIDDSASRF